MTTKNIQDVVAERVEEFRGKPYIQENGEIYVGVDAHWLTTTLTQLVKEVEAGERKAYKQAHKDFFSTDLIASFLDFVPEERKDIARQAYIDAVSKQVRNKYDVTHKQI